MDESAAQKAITKQSTKRVLDASAKLKLSRELVEIEGKNYQFIGSVEKPTPVEWTKHKLGGWKSFDGDPDISYIHIRMKDPYKVERGGIIISTETETQLWYLAEGQ